MPRVVVTFALTLALGACFRDGGNQAGTSETGAAGSSSSTGEPTSTTLDPTRGGATGSGTETGESTSTGASDDTSGGGSSSTGAPSTTGEDPLPSCGYLAVPVDGLVGARPVVADFDLDGFLDVATQPASGTVQLFLGDGSGVDFTPGESHSIGASGRMAVGDFDGDGTPDLVHYGFSFTAEIGVQLNFSGVLGPAIVTEVGAIFFTARVADVDGDGDSDFSYAGATAQPAHVLLADTGQFIDAHLLHVSACYATASDWADFNGDGELDFVVIGDCNAPLGTPSIAVHLRSGATYMPIATAGQAQASDHAVLEAGDFDGDGLVDVVTQGARKDGAFERHLGLGDGSFAAREPFPLPPATWVVTALDADGDGLTDLLTDAPGGVVLQRSTGVGFVACAVGPGRVAAVADLDGDAVLDVLLATDGAFALAKTP